MAPYKLRAEAYPDEPEADTVAVLTGLEAFANERYDAIASFGAGPTRHDAIVVYLNDLVAELAAATGPEWRPAIVELGAAVLDAMLALDHHGINQTGSGPEPVEPREALASANEI